MKYLAEYRDAKLIQGLLDQIDKITSRSWVIMEICGGQTHSIMRNGLDQLLPKKIELVHGPGCPVCVTSIELVNKAIAIASLPNVIFTSYGDMLRVPGSHADLFKVRAQGGDVRVVYSPLDAVKIAQDNPQKEVVFFAIGFETTAPANISSLLLAKSLKLRNFSTLVSHVRVPPAMHAILNSPENRVQGFLAAGHVCSVMGYWEYLPIAETYQVPIVVTGFEPLDILNGIMMSVTQLEARKYLVENAYTRLVTLNGNEPAQKVINNVFEECDRNWRGIGLIPNSGWRLRAEFSDFDAEKKYVIEGDIAQESPLCIAGLILQGIKKPRDCPAFGSQCNPEIPLGATMVSSEGACAAYYRYGRK
jgi:hydrogenase expression/formation protein HypD